MKQSVLILFLLTPLFFFAQNGGGLKIEVISKTSHTPIDSAKIIVFIADKDSVTGFTDSTGWCRIKPLGPGFYTLIASKKEYEEEKIVGIVVSENKITYLNSIELSALETTPIHNTRKKKKQKS